MVYMSKRILKICCKPGVLPEIAFKMTERGTFFRLLVYEGVGISLVEQ